MAGEAIGLSLGGMEGQVALVVGGASGIGLAAVRALACADADVVIADLNEAGAQAAADEVEALGKRALGIGVDVADVSALGSVIERTVADLRRIDALVYAAGLPDAQGWLDLSAEEWDKTYAVNVRGAFVLAQHFARHVMSRGGGGRIVNVASGAGFRAVPGGMAYAGSKAALAQLTRSLAAELAPFDVNVNTVAPGVTRTPMVLRHYGSDEELQRRVEDSASTANLFGRVSEPEDVAAVILFLCLPASRQITAQVIHTSAGAIV